MSDDTANRDAAAAARAMQDMGLTGFMEQVTQLQEELLEMRGRLAETEDLLGKSLREHLETFEGGSKSLKQPD